MWKYRRRLSIRPMQTAIMFAGSRLTIAADGRVLSHVSDELAMKMKKSPHSFIFDASLKADEVEVQPEPVMVEVEPEVEATAAEEESDEDDADEQKVETSSDKDDNNSKRKRRSRKSAEG